MMPEPDIEGSERGKFMERGRRKMLHVAWVIVVLGLPTLALCGRGSVEPWIGHGWVVLSEEMAGELTEGCSCPWC